MTQQQKQFECLECGGRFNSEAELRDHERECKKQSIEQEERHGPEQEKSESTAQRRRGEDPGKQRQDEGQRRHQPVGTPGQK